MGKLEKLRTKLREQDLEAIVIWEAKNRFYFSGFTGTAGLLLITAADQYLITDFRYFDQGREEAPTFELVPAVKNLLSALTAKLQELNIKNLGFEETYWTYAEFQKIEEKILPLKIELIPAGDLIKELRLIKNDQELAIIQKAAQITDEAFTYLMGQIKAGMTEREVALELEYFMRKRGARGPSFDYIVASGKRSALPHGVATNKKIEPGELVTIDFGCIYQGYCSDMTRNFIIGEPTKKQQEIYDLVLAAQLEALAGIQAGITGQAADKLARDIIVQANYGDNFGHGLGHGVGLDIHEGPSLGSDSELKLKPGMVVTVEPGIYISDWGGVRIEDMIIVQETENQILTKSPKHLYII